MRVPAIPANEALRLKTLHDSGLLDTPPEERFDRLTRLAQALFQVPVALVSLVDSNRQWFKSCQGLQVSETPRDISFCGHAILGDQILCIPDALQDERFADNPLVTGEPHIRFYAGAPLRARNGAKIGTLCVIGREAMQPTPQQLAGLRDLADCVEAEVRGMLAQRQHGALLTLTRITALSSEDNLMLLRDMLALGCEYLQMERAVISRIQGDQIDLLAHYPEQDPLLNVFPVPRGASYSDLLNHTHQVLCIEHMALSPYASHPSYQRFGQECYAGAPVFVNQVRYGTLGFSSRQPRQQAFTDPEIEFITILSDWISATLRRLELDRSLHQQQQINEAIAKAQSYFISGDDLNPGFELLLDRVTQLTDSEFGFIGEVLYEHGQPYLKLFAVTNIAWDQHSHENYRLSKTKGIEFRNLNSLFGKVMTSREIVISNDPAQDPRSGGTPEGHPPLKAFMGLPVHHQGQMLAVVGLGNRAGGYAAENASILHPVLIAIGQLVSAWRYRKQHQESERRLANIIEGTQIGTWECHIPTGNTVFNERWAQMLGYTLEELQPTSASTWLDILHPDDKASVTAMVERHFRGEIPFFDLVTRLRHKNGHWVWIRDRGCVVSWDNDGNPLVMSGSHQDITQERLAEEKLAHAYALLEQSNAAARIGTWEYDIGSGQFFWSRVTREIHEAGDKEVSSAEQVLAFYKAGKHRDRLAALLNSAVHEGIGFDQEFKLITPLLNLRWVRVIAVPQLKDQQLSSVYGIVQDITAQKEQAQTLQDHAAHIQAILDNVSEGIVTISHQGLLDAINPAAARLFGYEKEDLIGQHVRCLFANQDEQWNVLSEIRAMLPGNLPAAPRELEARCQDGHVITVDVSVSVVRRQSKPLYIALLRDITERKRLENIKSEFISTVSHELRTPLTSISGALSLILGGATGDLPPSLAPLLNIAAQNSQRLTSLINDLLDMEKLSAGQLALHIQTLALEPLLQQGIDSNQTFGARRAVRLVLQGDVPAVSVEVDNLRFMQVLSNLLSNAVKYSPSGETVSVRASMAGERVRVEVCDQGSGIPPEFRPRIFQKFAQADSSDTRERGGTGLGLAITRELVERMGGQIGFESEPGQGTCFYIELPCSPLPVEQV